MIQLWKNKLFSLWNRDWNANSNSAWHFWGSHGYLLLFWFYWENQGVALALQSLYMYAVWNVLCNSVLHNRVFQACNSLPETGRIHSGGVITHHQGGLRGHLRAGSGALHGTLPKRSSQGGQSISTEVPMLVDITRMVAAIGKCWNCDRMHMYKIVQSVSWKCIHSEIVDNSGGWNHSCMDRPASESQWNVVPPMWKSKSSTSYRHSYTKGKSD